MADDDDALEVIRQAERIVRATSWHLQEQTALAEACGKRIGEAGSKP